MAKRARHDLPAVQDKRAKVVELRAQGWTWDRIALEVGYSNGSAASKAWKAAIQQRPDLTVDEVRRQEKTRLEQMDDTLAEIIANPPAKTTAIGKTVTDPDTGEIVRDFQVVVASLRERRMVGESLRRLVSADAPSGAPIFDDRQVRMMAEVLTVKRDFDRQAPPPPLALPASYASMTPAEQAAADLAARRAQLDAQRAAIPGEIIE